MRQADARRPVILSVLKASVSRTHESAVHWRASERNSCLLTFRSVQLNWKNSNPGGASKLISWDGNERHKFAFSVCAIPATF
jgi:hypothetical protein